MHKKLSCLIFFALLSCDRPSRARFPGPPGRTTDFAQAQKTKEVLGGFDPTAHQGEEENSIRGVIKLKAGLKIPSEHYMIFISARPLGGGGGPPLAVLRLSPRKLPFRFALTQANVMLQGTELSGFVEVTVRIVQPVEDGSYNPLARQKGDLFGTKQVKVGARNAEIEISDVIK